MVFREIEKKMHPQKRLRALFYNMLLIKNLKAEEWDFIYNKKMCQSWRLREKVVCQTLRGPHWPKYKIVNSNPTMSNLKRTLGMQIFMSLKIKNTFKIPSLGISAVHLERVLIFQNCNSSSCQGNRTGRVYIKASGLYSNKQTRRTRFPSRRSSYHT